MTDLVVSGEECSGDRRQFWEHPSQRLICQGELTDSPEEQAHARRFHCHHWYEDQGCCACTVQTINLAVFDDGKPPAGKILIESDDGYVAVRGMESYLQFGEKMQWPGMRLSEARLIRNKLKKSINNIKAALLAK